MKAGSRTTHQSNATVISINLGRCLKGNWPGEVTESAREALFRMVQSHKLRGGWLQPFGEDLHVHITSYNADFTGSDSDRAVETATDVGLKTGLKALEKALDLGLASPEYRRLFSISLEEQIDALGVWLLNLPYTERGAEPIFVAKAINATWGFFNRALFNLFFNPDKGSGRRIEGNDYLAIVESVGDLANNLPSIRTYEFGPGQMNELVALIADAESWRLSAVYAVEGKFARSEYHDEPVALVEGASHPVLIGRCQSGLPALGEFTQAVGEFYFGPGGERGRYRVGLMPVSFEEALSISASPGTTWVVAYAYQSYDNGRLPAETDVVDVFAQNRPETVRLQREAGRLIECMTRHGEFEPYLNPQASEERAYEEADRLASRFVSIPDKDPLIEAVNGRSLYTVSDIKADAGGKVGHTTPPAHFRFIAEASLEEAKKLGLILPTSRILEVGDDEHLLMTHERGADDNSIHLFAYRTFFRQIWVAQVLGYKWYGLGQDLIGEASAGRAIEELANLSETFLSLLPDFLPPADRARSDRLKRAFQDWRSGARASREPAPPFSGNISGQGPGFAEIPVSRPQRIGLLAIDKAGPSAFNLPIWWSLNECLRDGSLLSHVRRHGGRGVLVEIWDIERHRRAFLDLDEEALCVQRLLGAVDKFNVKRVWSRTTDSWSPDRVSQSLGDILLAASTEKLAVISGGEYRGKDDPVLLAVEPLAKKLHEFMRDHFYMTQGDGRGSHFMFPAPLPLKDAVATIYSRAVAVSAWIDLDADGQISGLEDVFADPVYEAARDRAFTLNKSIWDAQGGNFIPVGVGASKVEPAYPLAKTIARITAADSKFASKRYSRDLNQSRARQHAVCGDRMETAPSRPAFAKASARLAKD